MTDRTEQVVAMSRRALARLHADELNAALFPAPGLADDDLSEEEKTSIQANVAAVRVRHAEERAIWTKANT